MIITSQEDKFAYVVLAVWDDSENGEWTTETALLGSFKTLEEAQALVDRIISSWRHGLSRVKRKVRQPKIKRTH